MDLIKKHRDELHRSIHGPAWHGSALIEILADVSPPEAAARPLGRAHTIAEITAHCIAWIEEVERRLHTGNPAMPARGDWPAIPSPLDGSGWTALRNHIEQAATNLDAALRDFPAERLDEYVGGVTHDPPSGSGMSFAMMLHGLAQHNAYHGGQIAYIKRGLKQQTAAPSDVHHS